jgi:hypothetical protein
MMDKLQNKESSNIIPYYVMIYYEFYKVQLFSIRTYFVTINTNVMSASSFLAPVRSFYWPILADQFEKAHSCIEIYYFYIKERVTNL